MQLVGGDVEPAEPALGGQQPVDVRDLEEKDNARMCTLEPVLI